MKELVRHIQEEWKAAKQAAQAVRTPETGFI